jgi:hypothetical protein
MQLILIYAKPIMTIMIVEAFWAKHWDEQEVHDRILSASAVAMIIDKMNKVPVGFAEYLWCETRITMKKKHLATYPMLP